ncbi:MAG: antibiotic biosynthesis monooxygenase family protein [Ilumatobacteraceae bacterium]
MSVVKINAIDIPAGMGPQLEERFAGRARMVEGFDGFEDFQLLRPTEGEERYFVYTRWASEEAFQAWMASQDFERGHASGQADGGSAERKPVAQGASLMSFDVVEHVVKDA